MRRPPRIRRLDGVARRGVALAAVVVVGLGLLLLAVGLLHVVRAEVAAIASGESRVQSRFAARAATRVLMESLARERAVVLAGGGIEPPDSFELFEIGDGASARLAIARLLPLGPGGVRIVPEAGRLDLNMVDADALVATGLVDRVEADTIVAARNARPGRRFSGVLDVLALEGDAAVGPRRVLGPLEDLRILSRIDDGDDDVGERIAARLDVDLGSGESALVDVLTVHAFEPDVRQDGTPRSRIGTTDPDLDGLDDSTARLVRAVLGDASALESGVVGDDVESVLSSTSAEPPESSGAAASPVAGGAREPGEIVASLAPRLPEADLGLAVDAVTSHVGGWRNGLLDINTAPAEALRGIEGISPDLAAAIVARRDTVPEDRRFDRFWPVAEELVDLATWGPVADRITTRCTVWRVLMAVGLVPLDDPEASLESPIAWEVVVDLGEPRPRLVEVRDVTLLEIVARMLAVTSAESSIRLEAGSSAVDEADGLFVDEPLFPDEPLFSDDPLFMDDPLFADDPLFPDDALFPDPPAGDRPARSREPAASEVGPTGPRDRGPGGRWRPATSTR